MLSVTASTMLNAIRRRRPQRARSEENDDDGYDSEQDSTITAGEIQAQLGHLNIHVEILAKRIELEWAMCQMMIKLPNFLLCLLGFVVGLYTLAPTKDIAVVNHELLSHFHLEASRLQQITSIDDVYAFLSDFSAQNEELMATSPSYWCESRYMVEEFDEVMRVPVRRCPSPRLYSLGFIKEGVGASWSELHAAGKLAASAAAASADGATVCVDDDALLMKRYNNSSLLCETSAQWVCETSYAIHTCPQTCGFCGPFTYKRVKKFVRPQFTMLPVIVHQSRLRRQACSGFARVYQQQSPNPNLVKMPALDGERDEEIITCIDRSAAYDEEWADVAKCPPSLQGSAMCQGGMLKDTRKVLHHGSAIYPKMLRKPSIEIPAMKAIDWIDVQTRMVEVNTFVYSEANDMFSFVAVDFNVDEAGRVIATKQIVTYKDLGGTSGLVFSASMITSIIFSFLGVVHPFLEFVRRRHCKKRILAFELCSRTALILYCSFLLVTWHRQRSMADSYMDILNSSLSYDGESIGDFTNLLQRYYHALADTASRQGVFMSFRIAAYMILYMQFIQLMLYFSFHPRMGVLTATVAKASSALAHFFAIFVLLFMMLAFMAHWMLGTHILEFETFGITMASQARMLFGEFIYVDSADEIDGLLLIMYWMYAFTFMLVVFFTLLNFFLAIIVDAFAAVKQDEKANMTEHDFINDCIDAPLSCTVFWRHRWPTRQSILRHLRRRAGQRLRQSKSSCIDDAEKTERVIFGIDEHEEVDKVSVPEFMEVVPGFADTDALAAFLRYYYLKVPVILSRQRRKKRHLVAPSMPPVAESSSRSISPEGSTVGGSAAVAGTAAVVAAAAAAAVGNGRVQEEPADASSLRASWEEHLQEALQLSPHLLAEDVVDNDRHIDWDLEALALARRIMRAAQEYRADRCPFTTEASGESNSAGARCCSDGFLDRLDLVAASPPPPAAPVTAPPAAPPAAPTDDDGWCSEGAASGFDARILQLAVDVTVERGAPLVRPHRLEVAPTRPFLEME